MAKFWVVNMEHQTEIKLGGLQWERDWEKHWDKKFGLREVTLIGYQE